MADADGAAVTKQVVTVVENTFHLTAADHNPEFVFKSARVTSVISALLHERLQGQVYDPVTGTQTAKALAGDIREHVKALGFARHKLIVEVTLSQQVWHTMRSVSRALWDTDSDGSASASFQNDSLICVGQVHGLYYE